jgi:chitinase
MSQSVNYQVVDQWSGGFNAAVGLIAGAGGLQGWTITFAADFLITQIWNARIISHVGDTYVIGNLAWNGALAAGQSAGFGFLGSATTDPNPDAFVVRNGLAAPLPSLAIADTGLLEGQLGIRQMSFAVTLSAASAMPVTVAFATADGTALAGSDYVAQSGLLTFAAGETRKVIRVTVNGDTAAEANEALNILLSNATGATIADATAVGRINDDDTPPALRISDVTLTEGNAGTSEAVFTIRLSKAWSQAVTVGYATQDGTARAGTDYISETGLVTFAAGQTVKTIAIDVVGDRLAEVTERFSVLLRDPAGATIADGTGVATITDTDARPTIGVADVTLTEADSGTTNAVFTVTLNKAWDLPVTVRFATANGTALAGEDYVAWSGTLTFAAGETSKTVAVAVRGDDAIEADEAFSLVLSAPTNATIRDATGIATIRNDDIATGPVGFLSTEGNQIVDAAGNAVRITGVNWFGMESDTYTPHGLWTRNWSDMMEQMADTGFNTIRLPFSLESLQPGKVPNGINFGLNPDLAGLSALQILDRIVDKAGELGMRIILDSHRSAAGPGPNPNGLWVDGGYTEQQWIDGWKMLAARYAGDPTVIGADLANEPHNAVWGGGGATDWAAAAERAGNAIHSVNDDWLIFVEGVETYAGANTWWGGNLMGVAFDQVVLNTPNKVVYSPHEYGNSIYEQPWFQGADFPNNLPARFERFWGYIYEQDIAPIFLGEFGSKLQDPKDLLFLDKLLAYLDGDFDANGTIDIAADEQGMSWTWWSWNPNSGDTGGILSDDWTTVIDAKVALLQGQLSDLWPVV